MKNNYIDVEVRTLAFRNYNFEEEEDTINKITKCLKIYSIYKQ